MTYYLDTNVIVSLIFNDANSIAAADWFEANGADCVISQWGATEFHALLNRWLRSRVIEAADAASALSDYEALVDEAIAVRDILPEAGRTAALLAREEKLKLSAADALHLACAAEAEDCLVTFDDRLAQAARTCGIPCLVPIPR